MANKPLLVTHTEPVEAVFIFGDRIQDEVHVFLREEAGRKRKKK